jgi:hypothetical protein
VAILLLDLEHSCDRTVLRRRRVLEPIAASLGDRCHDVLISLSTRYHGPDRKASDHAVAAEGYILHVDRAGQPSGHVSVQRVQVNPASYQRGFCNPVNHLHVAAQFAHNLITSLQSQSSEYH